MQVEAEGRQNHNLPIKRIGIIFGLFLQGGWGCLYLEPVLRTCLWTVTHRSTATLQGLSIRVPRMWRQEETPLRLREISLIRARWGDPASVESIVIMKAAAPSKAPLLRHLASAQK